jgi:hypothetical protein
MPVVRYHKSNLTNYVLHFSRGRLVREGAGMSFYYFSPLASIVFVPLASSKVPFVFDDPTADFQMLTVQGQMMYRIIDAKSKAAMLDFTVGMVSSVNSLNIESQMPVSGVIFSDGVEADGLNFNSGAMVTIGIARERANLVKVEKQ